MSEAVLARPPESYRPDRSEIVQEPLQQPLVELGLGVLFDRLIGPQIGARNLTTGIASFRPAAQLSDQRYPVSVSLTVLEGFVGVKVDGHEYQLQRLDNIVIPGRGRHTTRNVSVTEPARLHLAWASASPEAEPALTRVVRLPMTESPLGLFCRPHLTRFASAPRSSAGPGTSFIDYFNQDLIPGIEMSGGYGLFHPGGRLPAHFHDFDESICIISGTATCLVEGRHHQMSGEATALQPRGRVHYFVNESDGPMEMIWVYGGPLPERILVAEQCASTPGVAWEV